MGNCLNCLCNAFWLRELNGCVHYINARINEHPLNITLQERRCYFTVRI